MAHVSYYVINPCGAQVTQLKLRRKKRPPSRKAYSIGDRMSAKDMLEEEDEEDEFHDIEAY